MTTEQALLARSEFKCELCGATDDLSVYEIPPALNDDAEECILICLICRDQVDGSVEMDVNHWRCLNDSMWSQVPAVQVMAWRMLTRLSAEGWPQELLDILYLDEVVLNWAMAAGETSNPSDEDKVTHIDSNGVVIEAGDTVTLIKDLNVKGAGFTAKRGTAVRGISLVADNAEHIEGRINGQKIIILTKFVKK